jgi:hypothetical protein
MIYYYGQFHIDGAITSIISFISCELVYSQEEPTLCALQYPQN